LICINVFRVVLRHDARRFDLSKAPMTPHRHAVVYYTRTGHTARIARRVADCLGADVFQITTRCYGRGPIGYMWAGRDSLSGRLPPIGPVADLGHYSSVSLGSPVWTSYPATPLRAFLAQRPVLPPVVGLFFSGGDPAPPDKAIDMARALLDRPVTATLSVPNGTEDLEVTQSLIMTYVGSIRAAV
jgi:hypothetical protein